MSRWDAADLPPPAPARTPRRWGLRIALGAVFLLVLGAAGLFAWGYQRFDAPGPAKDSVTIVIPKGLGIEAIGRRLREAGVVDQPLVLSLAARLMRRAHLLKAGEYEFPAGITPHEILDMLVAGRTVVRRLTVPEGWTTAQILALIADAEGLDGPLTDRPAEGALLPETYHYSYGDSRSGLLRRMEGAMRQALDELWRQRAPNLPFATPADAVTLASIVEKETGIEAERPRVAAVFINRLRRGMKLDADPTVIYALTRGAQPLDRPLSRTDLAIDDPYNTYRHAGLPPGPIAAPGRAALAATLNPAETQDLYFVADGSGGHVFAETLDEHNRNVARLRQLERGTGGAAP